MVQVIIEDNGIGMNETLIDQILKNDLIKSNKGLDGEKGSGIGLQLVKQLIQRNKGTISIRSILAKGTIFKLNLPIAS